jgi:site-specific DNA recombinase
VLKDLFAYAFAQSKITAPQISNMSLLEVLHDQYNSIAQKLRRLYNLYAENEDEILTQTIGETKKELKKIQLQIENETEKSKNQSDFVNLKKTLSTLTETWEYMTPKEKKHLLHECINKITITDSSIHVDYKFSEVYEDE